MNPARPAGATTRPALPPGPWLVVGLARSGVAAARALRARGEEVVGVDAAPVGGAPPPSWRPSASPSMRRPTGSATSAACAPLCKSPGVPREAPVVAAALARGLPVLGELELGWRLLPNEVVAVTGTNGKTTTTELLGHVHRVAGLPVAVAGNVGTALTSLAGALEPAATVVLEASSFQLEDTDAFAPECAVLLNLAPDHLDRHGSFEAYARAKLRVFAHQGNDDVAVAPDDLGVEDLGGCARRVCFGTGPEAELGDRGGALWWDRELLVRHEELALRGAHNRAQRDGRGGGRAGPRDPGGRGARGPAHVPRRRAPPRGGRGARRGHVRQRLQGHERRLDRRGAGELRPSGAADRGRPGQGPGLRRRSPARCASTARRCTSSAATRACCATRWPPTGVALDDAGDLGRAVRGRAAAARPGDVVLLSPACASFDQFADFEARGRRFKALVTGG